MANSPHSERACRGCRKVCPTSHPPSWRKTTKRGFHAHNVPFILVAYWPQPPIWPRPYRILFPRKAPLFLRGFLIEPPTSDAGASGDNHSGDMGDSRRNGDGSKGDSSRNTGGNSRSGRDNTHTHNTDNAVRY